LGRIDSLSGAKRPGFENDVSNNTSWCDNYPKWNRQGNIEFLEVEMAWERSFWLPLWYLEREASDYLCGILREKLLITHVVSWERSFWLPLWYLEREASDYPCGILRKKLLITPVVSWERSFWLLLWYLEREASDYSCGILRKKLLITPVVSSIFSSICCCNNPILCPILWLVTGLLTKAVFLYFFF
jgi:hypothetical protein